MESMKYITVYQIYPDIFFILIKVLNPTPYFNILSIYLNSYTVFNIWALPDAFKIIRSFALVSVVLLGQSVVSTVLYTAFSVPVYQYKEKYKYS